MTSGSGLLPFYLVLVLAILPMPTAVLAALCFNAKTFRIVAGIQREYRQKGLQWGFWNHRERLVAFALNPKTLLTEDPVLARSRKTLLIRHRRRLKSYLTYVFALALASFTLAIAMLLLMASTPTTSRI